YSLRIVTLLSTTSFTFLFNDPATTEIYTLSLHDALPICHRGCGQGCSGLRYDAHPATVWPRRREQPGPLDSHARSRPIRGNAGRSEEHTSELQSLRHLVCRLLLEKKKKNRYNRSSVS